jgi:hypothetical protein
MDQNILPGPIMEYKEAARASRLFKTKHKQMRKTARKTIQKRRKPQEVEHARAVNEMGPPNDHMNNVDLQTAQFVSWDTGDDVTGDLEMHYGMHFDPAYRQVQAERAERAAAWQQQQPNTFFLKDVVDQAVKNEIVYHP